MAEVSIVAAGLVESEPANIERSRGGMLMSRVVAPHVLSNHPPGEIPSRPARSMFATFLTLRSSNCSAARVEAASGAASEAASEASV